MFIYVAIKHYKKLRGVEHRARLGRLKSMRAEAAIQTVREGICRNPLWKQIMSRKANVSTQSSRVSSGTIYNMRAHFCSKGHFLIPALKEIRRTRAKRLLQWHAENGHENIFTDEKIFTIEELYNNQYNAQTSLEVRSEGAGRLSPFLRHGLVEGVPSGGDTSSFLRERSENWCPSVSRACATRSCETS